MVHDPSRRRRAIDRLVLLGAQARQGQPTSGAAETPARNVLQALPEHWTGQSATGFPEAGAQGAPEPACDPARPHRRRKTDRR
ncbi:MAG: hypothetical protein EOO24_19985 [Comamonadaceae bacterium]|nr:MAG: hypothetical protein EOO24_19985 [Comamonadaceae bacterium]